MRSKLTLGLLVLAIAAAGVAPVQAQDSWLHIRVVDRDEDGEHVNINVPLKLIESLLPMIDTRDEAGDVHMANGRIYLNCHGLEGFDLPVLLKAVPDADDGEYITVQDGEDNVRVAKEKGDLIINADYQDEHVKVRVKMTIVEAMLKADDKELDLVAGVKALQEQGEGELVSVESDQETVRIWIDKQGSE